MTATEEIALFGLWPGGEGGKQGEGIALLVHGFSPLSGIKSSVVLKNDSTLAPSQTYARTSVIINYWLLILSFSIFDFLRLGWFQAKWSQMIPNPDVPRWSQMVPDDLRWSQDGPTWSQTRWFQMMPDDHRWNKIIPGDLRRDDLRRSQTRWSQVISNPHGARWSKCYLGSFAWVIFAFCTSSTFARSLPDPHGDRRLGGEG